MPDQGPFARGPPGGGPPGGEPSGRGWSTNSSESIPDVTKQSTYRRGPSGGGPLGNNFERSNSPNLPPHLENQLLHHQCPGTDASAVQRVGEFHLNRKLKHDIVPSWDGNSDTLDTWLLEINDLADRGPTVYTKLGQIIPFQLKDKASDWFWSLDYDYWKAAEQSWGTLQKVICEYWMNHIWLDKQKNKALHATYRQSGHNHELPTEYVI